MKVQVDLNKHTDNNVLFGFDYEELEERLRQDVKQVRRPFNWNKNRNNATVEKNFLSGNKNKNNENENTNENENNENKPAGKYNNESNTKTLNSFGVNFDNDYLDYNSIKTHYLTENEVEKNLSEGENKQIMNDSKPYTLMDFVKSNELFFGDDNFNKRLENGENFKRLMEKEYAVMESHANLYESLDLKYDKTKIFISANNESEEKLSFHEETSSPFKANSVGSNSFFEIKTDDETEFLEEKATNLRRSIYIEEDI